MPAEEGRDGLARLLERARLGQAGIDGDAEVDAGLGRMARLGPGAAVRVQRALQLRDVHVAKTHEDRQPQLGDERKGLGGIGGHPERRMRLLIRTRRDGGVLEAVELAVVAERLALPGFLDDLERLAKARLALAIGNAEDIVGARGSAAPDPELEAALAQMIDGGGFLRDAQRVVEGQDIHRRADVEALGAAGDGGGHGDRRGDDGAGRVEVDLPEPHAVEAESLGRVRGLEGLAKRVSLTQPGPGFFEEDAEVHGGGRVARRPGLFKARFRASRACYYPVVFHSDPRRSRCHCSDSLPAPTASPISSPSRWPRPPSGARAWPRRRSPSAKARPGTSRTGTRLRAVSSSSSCRASSRSAWATAPNTSSARAMRGWSKTRRARGIPRKSTGACRA